MNQLNSHKNAQHGSVLLEALIAILIFSMGILAIVGLQAAAIKTAADAKYRSDASMLANQLIGQMWVSNRKTIQAQFSSPAGVSYLTWLNDVKAALPGVDANLPSVVDMVTLTQNDPADATKDDTTHTVTLILNWQSPGETTVHKYTISAQINE